MTYGSFHDLARVLKVVRRVRVVSPRTWRGRVALVHAVLLLLQGKHSRASLGSPALVDPSIAQPMDGWIVTCPFLVGPAKQSGDPAYIPAMATIMDKHSIAKG